MEITSKKKWIALLSAVLALVMTATLIVPSFALNGDSADAKESKSASGNSIVEAQTVSASLLEASGEDESTGGMMLMATKPTPSAQAYYVSASGSDTGGDGTQAAPFATIKKAVETAPTGSATTPTQIYIMSDLVNPTTATVGGKHIIVSSLPGNTYTISIDTNATLFTVTSGSIWIDKLRMTNDITKTSDDRRLVSILSGSGASVTLGEDAEVDGWRTTTSLIYVNGDNATVTFATGSSVNNCMTSTSGAVCSLFNKSNFTLEVEKDALISNCATGPSAIGGGAFYLEGPNQKTTINGTIERCTTLGQGGAIYAYGNPVKVTLGPTALIDGCSAKAFGGGLYVSQKIDVAPIAEGSAVTLQRGAQIRDCDVYGSKLSLPAGGGGMYVKGADSTKSPNTLVTTIENGATISGCTAIEIGGGINKVDGILNLYGTIQDCSAGAGGGIYTASFPVKETKYPLYCPSAYIEINNGGKITGCKATGAQPDIDTPSAGDLGYGGAIGLGRDETIRLYDGEISECTAAGGGGGGIGGGRSYVVMTDPFVVKGCSASYGGAFALTGGLSAYGGLIEDCHATGAAATATGVKKSFNKRNGSSGAMDLSVANSYYVFFNLTIKDCTAAEYGGAIYQYGAPMFICGINVTNCSAGKGGGGIYANQTNMLTRIRDLTNVPNLNGGKIPINETPTPDGGIVNTNVPIYIQGNTCSGDGLDNNLEAKYDWTIVVLSTLAPGSSIGITVEDHNISPHNKENSKFAGDGNAPGLDLSSFICDLQPTRLAADYGTNSTLWWRLVYAVRYNGNGNDRGVAPEDIRIDKNISVLNPEGTDYVNMDIALLKQYKENDQITVLGNVGEFKYPLKTYYPAGTGGYKDDTPLAKDGYKFIGWNTNQTEANKGVVEFVEGNTFSYNAAKAVDGTITLYAVWAQNEYKIVYNNGTTATGVPTGSIAGSPFTVGALTNNHAAQNPAGQLTPPVGYVFTGWLGSDGKTYQPGDPVKVSDANTTEVAGQEARQLTLTAQWKLLDGLTVTYKANTPLGATQIGTVPTQTYLGGADSAVYGDALTVESPGTLDMNTHTFVNWNTKPDGRGITYVPGSSFNMPAGDLELYAIWDTDPYNLSWVVNAPTGDDTTFNAQNMPTQRVNVQPTSPYFDWVGYLDATAPSDALGDQTLAKDPTKTGYEFLGWYLSKDAADAAAAASQTAYASNKGFARPTDYDLKGGTDKTSRTIKGSTIFYGSWLKLSAGDIYFDPNGGNWEGDEDIATVALEADATVAAEKWPAAPAKDDYIFMGWWNKQDYAQISAADAVRYTSADTFVPGTTLYAVWAPNTDGNGDGVPDVFQVKMTYTPDPKDAGSIDLTDAGKTALSGSGNATGDWDKNADTGVLTEHLNRGGLTYTEIAALLANPDTTDTTTTAQLQKLLGAATLTADMVPEITDAGLYVFDKWSPTAPAAGQFSSDTNYTASWKSVAVTGLGLGGGNSSVWLLSSIAGALIAAALVLMKKRRDGMLNGKDGVEPRYMA